MEDNPTITPVVTPPAPGPVLPEPGPGRSQQPTPLNPLETNGAGVATPSVVIPLAADGGPSLELADGGALKRYEAGLAARLETALPEVGDELRQFLGNDGFLNNEEISRATEDAAAKRQALSEAIARHGAVQDPVIIETLTALLLDQAVKTQPRPLEESFHAGATYNVLAVELNQGMANGLPQNQIVGAPDYRLTPDPPGRSDIYEPARPAPTNSVLAETPAATTAERLSAKRVNESQESQESDAPTGRNKRLGLVQGGFMANVMHNYEAAAGLVKNLFGGKTNRVNAGEPVPTHAPTAQPGSDQPGGVRPAPQPQASEPSTLSQPKADTPLRVETKPAQNVASTGPASAERAGQQAGISLSGPAAAPVAALPKSERINAEPTINPPVPAQPTKPADVVRPVTTTASVAEPAYRWEQIAPTLEKFGLTKEILTATNNLGPLLAGQPTGSVLLQKTDPAGEVTEVRGKLKVLDKPGEGVTVYLAPERTTPLVPKLYNGYQLTADDRATLTQKGDLGRPVTLVDPTSGESYKALLSLDAKTKQLTELRMDKVIPPMIIQGVTLTKEQAASLIEGNKIKLDGMKGQNGQTFSGYAQLSVAKQSYSITRLAVPAPNLQVTPQTKQELNRPAEKLRGTAGGVRTVPKTPAEVNAEPRSQTAAAGPGRKSENKPGENGRPAINPAAKPAGQPAVTVQPEPADTETLTNSPRGPRR